MDLIQDDNIAIKQKTIGNQALSNTNRQEKYDTLKIELFEKRINQVACIIRTLIIMLCIAILAYCFALVCHPDKIPANFWHIPTILGLLSSIVIVASLRAIVIFGNEKPKENNENETNVSDLTTAVDLLDKLKNLLSK